MIKLCVGETLPGVSDNVLLNQPSRPSRQCTGLKTLIDMAFFLNPQHS